MAPYNSIPYRLLAGTPSLEPVTSGIPDGPAGIAVALGWNYFISVIRRVIAC